MASNLLTARRVLDEFKKCGITHIVWLSDHYDAAVMQGMMKNEPGITVVPVCREGEAIPIAAGLLLGGKKPVVLHQSSGLFEAGDSVRGVALDLKLPLLLVMGYRGWSRDKPITDSAAVFLEPMLNAWGVKYYLVESDGDADKISQAYQEANETNRTLAVLIGKEYS